MSGVLPDPAARIGIGQRLRSWLSFRGRPKPTRDVSTMSQSALIWMRFRRHKLALISLYLLGALYAVAIFAEFFAPYDKDHRDLDYIYCPPQLPKFNFRDGLHVPFLQQQVDPVTLRSYYVTHPDKVVPLGFFVRGEPYRMWGLIPMERRLIGIRDNTSEHWTADTEPGFYFLGADEFGRDVFSRLIFGSRISLSIGLIAITITFILGIILGGISGYIGGTTDVLIQRLIEIINAFPHLPMWLALAAILPATWSPLQVYFAITVMLSLLGWTGLARVVRGKILSLRDEDYAVAARLLGASHSRILFRHLVPGFTSHIIVTLSLSIPAMILGETALSFLGIGLRPPVVSWGVMLQACMQLQTVANYPWLLMPVVVIILTVLSFNFVGDGLRDAADPYASR